MTPAHPVIHETIEPSGDPLPNTESAEAILVLGMHRSGTSAMARVLNLLGVELGSDLLPPAADNEMGFWEHREVQFIHDRIYEVLKVDWTNVSPLPVNWWERPEIEPYRKLLREILVRDFGKHRLWGIKDPRLCAMLPLWRPLLGELNTLPKCPLICRNPTEIAKSLGKRDGLSSSRVYLLWLRSIIDSEKGSRGLPRCITTFDRVLADWPGEVARMAQALDVRWSKQVSEVTAEVSDFIRPSVRHHQVDDEKFLADDQVPALVRRLYAAVLKAAQSGEMTELSATVDTVAEELDHGHPLLSRFVQDLEQEHRNSVIERQVEEKRLHMELGLAREGNEANASLAKELGRQVAELRQQAAVNLQGFLAEHDRLQGEIVVRDQRLLQTEAQIRELLEKDRALEARVADQSGKIEQLRSTKAQVREELDQYQLQRMMLLRVMQRMQGSKSWQWSAPLRDFRRPPLTERELLPVSKMEKLGTNHWQCDGAAQFMLPCLPIEGRIKIELKLSVNVAGKALLYFDTGHLFNPDEFVDLGPVDGEMTIEREANLTQSVHCFRLDPIDRSAEFRIERFRISRI